MEATSARFQFIEASEGWPALFVVIASSPDRSAALEAILRSVIARVSGTLLLDSSAGVAMQLIESLSLPIGSEG
jgi:hypothetical protein